MVCWGCNHCGKCGLFDMSGTLVCAQCGTSVEPGEIQCSRCGSKKTRVLAAAKKSGGPHCRDSSQDRR